MTSEKQTIQHILELARENMPNDGKDGYTLDGYGMIAEWCDNQLSGKIEPLPLIIVVEGGVVQEVVNSDDGYYLLDWDLLKNGSTITRKLAEICIENDLCTMDDIDRYIGEDD